MKIINDVLLNLYLYTIYIYIYIYIYIFDCKTLLSVITEDVSPTHKKL